MDIASLQDNLAKGLGIAARKVGMRTTVYRPLGASQPLGEHRKVITLWAAFEAKTQMSSNSGVTSPIWHGVFDASYTRQADYLVSPMGIFFIGSQIDGNPIQCVLTNRTVGISRPTFTPQGGYSGFSPSESEITLVGWPASIIQPSGAASGDVSGSRGFGTWTILLPILPAAPHPTDVITDDLGSTYVVSATEQTSMGWRLHVRQTGA